MKVLLLEDEPSIRDFVRINLKRQGIEMVEAATGEEVMKMGMGMELAGIDIAILDVMLPGIGGVEVCRTLRSRFPRMGIIMLTARGQERDKVMGLEAGADDYVVKPFSPVELVARIKSLYRRLYPALDCSADVIVAEPFTLRLGDKTLLRGGQGIELTPKEFAIIRLLMENANKAVSRDEILTAVWGKHFVGELKIVDVNMSRIRQKIETDPAHPRYIETVWGHGYLWRRES
ncbi:response regulator transcription factor [Brevibacillus dissolubilis]|uniref:response regulator transcription factor n=1 Tax=Brevibacillus dissolubilis TaxID=1844116 RepID=UPI001115FDE1|nr:response regulator transcription factor [Brevibacillus dissolubilis]